MRRDASTLAVRGLGSDSGLFGGGWSWDRPSLHLHGSIRGVVQAARRGIPRRCMITNWTTASPASGPHTGSRYSFFDLRWRRGGVAEIRDVRSWDAGRWWGSLTMYILDWDAACRRPGLLLDALGPRPKRTEREAVVLKGAFFLS